MEEKRNESVLIANGVDIQIAGDDYLNKWIIVRLLAKAKMNKYDCLFWNKETNTPVITGDEIIELFNNMLAVANDVRTNKYDALVQKYNSKDIIETVADFKKNYEYELTSIEQIGMEDWILIFLIYLMKEKDIMDLYGFIKKGFEVMILDAIYCEGHIQNIYQKIGTKAKKFFRRYDRVFTLNYDNSMEKINCDNVFHLHGAYETEEIDERVYSLLTENAKRDNILYSYPREMIYCNCNAILDFCGNCKYQYALEVTEINKKTGEGCNYHFEDLENLTGELTIVGLATNNDRHIFDCINRSEITHIIYYYFGNKDEEKEIVLPVNKPYVVENVNKLWEQLNVKKPHNSMTANSIISKNQREVNKILDVFNSFYKKKITLGQVIKELQSIPVATEKIICDMMEFELNKEKYHEKPRDGRDLIKKFIEFGNILGISSIKPQSLYFLNTIKMKR